MPTAPRAFLIDLDDTILTAGRRPEVLLEVARERADEIAPHAPEMIADLLEAAHAAFWSDPERHKIARFSIPQARRQVVREEFARLSPALSEDIAHAFADRFTQAREAMTVFFPGALEGLAALRERGIRMALITNGSSATQRAKIDRFGLAEYFDHIQIEGEAGFGKPEDRAYHHAMQALGAAPHETWIVGDHLEWEIAAPQRLGLTAVWCDGYGRGLPEGSAVRPCHTVGSLSEIVGLWEGD